ncbi:hypothetical protein AB9K17_23970, partial [Salmonella enterica subsp. enterica serovar Kentucky]|uniref:hypothetical protein n=1 Tax=Salmonella enterica TaxID=28901 RepID=UPI003F4BFF20
MEDVPDRYYFFSRNKANRVCACQIQKGYTYQSFDLTKKHPPASHNTALAVVGITYKNNLGVTEQAW